MGNMSGKTSLFRKRSAPQTAEKSMAAHESHDADGNLLPLMLSELIAHAQRSIAEHGDMPLWVTTQVLGYDDTVTHESPVAYDPDVVDGAISRNYWRDKYAKFYRIFGSGS